MSRLGNGVGSVYKLSGTRKRPWVARKTLGFKLNGQPIYRYIGYYETKAKAMTALMDYNKAPYSLEGERLCDMYEGFMEGYIENNSHRSVQNIQSMYKHLEPLYEKSIATLTRKDLQLFFDELQTTELVKKRIKSLLRQILDYSIRYDVIQPERIAILDYIDLSSKIKTKTIDRSVITPEEIEWLYKMDDNISHLILFLIYTGMRSGEYSNLTEESIDEDMVVHIEKSKTPSGIRAIPLSDKAQNLAPLPHFVSNKSLRYHYDLWQKKTGFPHHMHDTRHTCASMLANAGIDKRIIQAILGHKGSDVTDNVYTHISIETMRDALNMI